MKKIDKTMILIGILLLTAIISTLYLAGTFSTVGEHCELGENEEVVCTKVSKGNIEGSMFAIFLSESNPDPGELVDVDLVISIPQFDGIKEATMRLYDRNNQVLNSWDFRYPLSYALGCSLFGPDLCSSYGKSVNLNTVSEFNAPITSGEYKLCYTIRETSGSLIGDECTNFNVGITDCPTDFCDRWITTDTAYHADLQQRACTKYGDAPLCSQRVLQEYRTVCDPGYVIEGTETSTAKTGWHNCAEPESEVDPNDPPDTPPEPPENPPEVPDEPPDSPPEQLSGYIVERVYENDVLSDAKCVQILQSDAIDQTFYEDLTLCEKAAEFIKRDFIGEPEENIPETDPEVLPFWAKWWNAIVSFFTGLFV
ncbi:MAG: hypothetical protein U9R08_03595 [Nanoarchaeota archaeon]|nr:hypothetical protein [Nanoarchaeota archaeon]